MTDRAAPRSAPRTAATLTTYALLAGTAGVSFLLPHSLSIPESQAAAPPDRIFLPGTVRDFRIAHADFDTVPAGGNGHYAGNISLAPDADGEPVFTGSGYRVNSNWRDSAARPIPPHLYQPTPTIRLGGGGPGPGDLDTYDASIGPYGGANVGPAPLIQHGAPMPAVNVPAALVAVPSAGDRTIVGGVLGPGDLHFDDLTLRNTVQISGATRILCDGGFFMQSDAILELQAGATLTMYMRDTSQVGHTAMLNVNTADPTRVTLYQLNNETFELRNFAQVHANLTAPAGRLELDSHTDFFGTYVGRHLHMNNPSDLHFNQPYSQDACGNYIVDTLGTAGAASTGGITSAVTFGHWYNEVLGENLATRYVIELVRSGGIYTYENDGFFPIDGQLLGNEGDAHNYLFTYAFRTSFTYDHCTGQYFEFEGCDDVWAFVGPNLAIDLGGMGTVRRQYVALDRLNLTDGTEYEFTFFYAQRQRSQSIFRLRTNIEFASPGPVTITAGFD